MRHRLIRLAVTATAVALVPLFGPTANAQTTQTKDNTANSRVITVTDAAGRKHTRVKPITAAERKAAAARLRAKRAAVAGATQTVAGEPLAATAGVAAAAALAPAPSIDAHTMLIGDDGQLIPDYSGVVPNYANSPAPAYEVLMQEVTDPITGAVTLVPAIDPVTGFTIPIINATTGLPVPTATPGGIRKFVDPLPNLYISGKSPAPAAGQRYIPVAVPDTVKYACATMYPPPAVAPPTCKDADYYEIEVGEYSEQLHTDLPPTTLRGYRQTNASDPLVNQFHYLGPVIVAKRGRPVRIKFTNSLPAGPAGNLFVPNDVTIMGSGTGPLNSNFAAPASTICKKDPVSGLVPTPCYTENRATVHLHGGVTPWISDGTPHQWITPAGETSAYKEGVSVYNVPDMPNPGKAGSTFNPTGSGSQTFYYTNDQSARLMFYHDHASGTTRLNVYIGEAAGYLLTDDLEQELIAEADPLAVPPVVAGPLAGLGVGIPLVIQDKTFVDATTIRQQDPTWNWGTGTTLTEYIDPLDPTRKMMLREPKTGDLWWPHVYMPAQNPYDISGANAMGRWHFGPWFWPPTVVPHGPIPNPYYDCNAQGLPDTNNPCTMPWQPVEIPSAPNPSWGAEAFLDTPMVNGAVYPVLNLEPKAYRFRVLNAAHDRFWNLQLYKAVDKNGPSISTALGAPVECTVVTDCTEVRMVPASSGAFPNDPDWPTDGRDGGVPDPTRKGPDFIYIGTEGGFLPMPVVVPQQPITWNMNATMFNVGNVEKHALLLGPAERADVIIDFSQYPGTTFILYNDAPAAFPALDNRNDYYTGAPDLRDSGGVFTPLAGFGPNIRTVMQINIAAGTAGTPFDIEALKAAWRPVLGPDPADPTKTIVTQPGVFQRGQDDIIVGQSAYDEAYGRTFPTTYPAWGVARIQDFAITIETVTGSRVQMPLQTKAIHDEMGATFDDYGRMSAKLGLELPGSTALQQLFVMQGYNDPATELVKLSRFGTPIGDPLEDGTQLWKITHNGVDTHPVHFHLFHVQLVNRVGWDGLIRLPHPTELGWKDTLRISPLEDTIVALRPIAPDADNLPFEVPNSIRPLNPSIPLGVSVGFSNRDPLGNNITVFNEVANFGWEYVWHCHILSHEENDMMRSVVFAMPPAGGAPTLSATIAGRNNSRAVVLTWTANTSLLTSGYTIVRATDPNFKLNVVKIPVGLVTTYSDVIGRDLTPYFYKVAAANVVGSTVPGFPSMVAETAFSNPVFVNEVVTPSNLVAQILGPNSVQLTFNDNAINETGFTIERSTDGVTFAPVGSLLPFPSIGQVSYTDATVTPGITYTYRVMALSSAPSGYSNLAIVTIDAPAAPSNLMGTAVATSRTSATVSLTWTDNATNESQFVLQRADDVAFATGLVQTTLPANTTTFTESGRIRGRTFFYRVAAVNPIGTSPFATPVAVTVP